jgi:hypothetical protein
MSSPKSPKRTKFAEMFLGKRDKDYDGLYVGAEENVAGEAIYDAVEKKDTKSLKKLCKEWGNVDAAINWRVPQYGDLFSPFLKACSEGYVGCVEILLKTKAIDVNQPDKEGATGLWWAVIRGHYKVVEILLKIKGIDKSKTLGLEYGEIGAFTAEARARDSNKGKRMFTMKDIAIEHSIKPPVREVVLDDDGKPYPEPDFSIDFKKVAKLLGVTDEDVAAHEHVATPGKKSASRGGTVNKRKRVRKTKRNNKK